MDVDDGVHGCVVNAVQDVQDVRLEGVGVDVVVVDDEEAAVDGDRTGDDVDGAAGVLPVDGDVGRG